MNFIHKHFTPYRDSAYQLSTVYCLLCMSILLSLTWGKWA